MKKILLALLIALALPRPGEALDTNDVLALVAMPLAVAAVSDIADVPVRDVANLVTALNRADVPPTQFVEVVRYAPMAIVDRSVDPPFVRYVTTRVDDGIVGEPLVLEIQERYRPYGVTQFDPLAPRYVVVENDPLPPVVVNQFGLDPLALVAMPLAVAAVAELTDVPMNDLMSLVMALNQRNVAPTQFVEIVRYSPVALLDDTARPRFIRYVTTDSGDLQRNAYALALAQELRTYGADDLDVVRVAEPAYVFDRTDILPGVVRNHPHGGPPGQIKKELGLQTGAEVVHGSKPGRDRDDDVRGRVVETIDRDRDRDADRDRSRAKIDKSKPSSDDRGVSKRRDSPPAAAVDSPGRGRGNSDRDTSGRGGGGGDKGNSGKGKGKGKG
jgi:hypothetical protein